LSGREVELGEIVSQFVMVRDAHKDLETLGGEDEAFRSEVFGGKLVEGLEVVSMCIGESVCLTIRVRYYTTDVVVMGSRPRIHFRAKYFPAQSRV
jgi:hypothetical protein